MTALADNRSVRVKKFKTFELPATASVTYYQAALACIDTSTGLVCQGKASATLLPIGLIAEAKTLGSGGGTVIVELFEEIVAVWMVNDTGTPIVAADLGQLAYILDDQTVAIADGSNARSVAGRIWAVDATKGVLVQFISPNGQRTESGLD